MLSCPILSIRSRVGVPGVPAASVLPVCPRAGVRTIALPARIVFSGTVIDPSEPGRQLHRAADERLRGGEVAPPVRLHRLPGPRCHGEVLDRFRPAAAAHHVRRQETRRRAGRADPVVLALVGGTLDRCRQGIRRHLRATDPISALGLGAPHPQRMADVDDAVAYVRYRNRFDPQSQASVSRPALVDAGG
jgi:hypothetical protein